MSTDQAKAGSPKLFNAIARRYDLLNRVLSFGMDISWRRKILKHLPDQSDLKVLDLATGTGDVAIFLAKGSAKIGSIVGIDLAEDMLTIGREKVTKAGLSSKIILQKGDAQKLPFADRSFDVVTVAFGVRNFPLLMTALIEARRVLKDNGRLIILEFFRPSIPIIREIHALYLRYLMPVFGAILTGNLSAYAYLSKTVMGFPDRARFSRIIRQVGFKTVDREDLCHGTAAIFTAGK